jgi:outer membrane receptor protein involved in Fe transport
MARTTPYALFALLAVVSSASPASATTQTGQILVTVAGSPDQAVTGATLKLQSPALIGGVREVTLPEDGSFRFQLLPPGVYEVEVSHPAYRSTKVGGLEVKIGHTTTTDVVLQLASDAEGEIEQIVVTGTRTVVDTERLTMGGSISAETLENLPVSRSYQSVALLLPGVNDTGGDGNPNVLGGTDYGNQYLLDGVNITDPVTNTFSANFNFDAMAEVEVLSGGRDAEYGNAVGGVINIVTRTGGNEFTADGSIYWESDELQLKAKGEEKLNNGSLEVNLNLGGPIIKDKLWYFISTEVPWTYSTPAMPEQGNPFPGTGLHPARDFKGIFVLGKLSWAVSDDHTLKLLVQADPSQIQNTRASSFVHPDAEREQIQTGIRVSLASEYFFTDDLLLNTRLAFNENGLSIHPQSDNYDRASHYNTDTGLTTGNDSAWYDDSRMRVQLHSSLAYTLDGLLGEHQLKAGVDIAVTRNSVFDSLTGGGLYTDALQNPDDPNSEVAPSQIERLIEPQDTAIWGDTEGVFVQDVWKPLDNLTVRPGLRFDSSRMRNWEGETQVAMNMLSPRFGVSWDPFGDGKTAIRGGYYQYVDTGFLTLSDFAGGNSKLTRIYDYNTITEQYDDFQYESGGPSSVVAKDYLKKAWNQRRPRTHELLFGVGREIIKDLGVSADFTYRYNGNQWEDTEENLIWSEDGSQVLGFRDGQAHYVYSLGALKESYIRYYGLQFAVDKALSNRWELTASYTWSKLEGTEPSIINTSFDLPYMRQYEYGYLPGDMRHVVKLDSSYSFPYGFVLGTTFRVYSGEPYNRFYLNPFYQSYSDRFAERGYDIDGKELRMPWRYGWNVRLKWDMEELIKQRFELIVEAFNVTNRRTAVDIETRNLPDGSFGQVTDKMSPLNFSLGMRYRF